MGKTNRFVANVIIFFCFTIISGCTSLAINVRDIPHGVKSETSAPNPLVHAPLAREQTFSAHNYFPEVVVLIGLLKTSPETDLQETENKRQMGHFAPPIYYDIVRDPRVQGNRPTKTGTGFIIEASNDTAIILTNNHVQANTDNLTVFLHDDRAYPARILWASNNSDFDIAFLEIKKKNPADPDETFAVAKLGNSDAASIGDRYLAIGHPYGLFYSAHTGTLAQIRSSFFSKDDTIWQMNMNIYPGHSGSPLINERGEIDGIIFAVKVNKINKENDWATAIGWAIPINPVKEKFREIQKK